MTETITQVGPVDPTKHTSEITPNIEDQATTESRAICLFNGVEFSTGAQVCSGGVRLHCNSAGKWFPHGRC